MQLEYKRTHGDRPAYLGIALGNVSGAAMRDALQRKRKGRDGRLLRSISASFKESTLGIYMALTF